MNYLRAETESRPAEQQFLSTGLLVRSLALARIALTTSDEIWTLNRGSTVQNEALDLRLESEARRISKEMGSLKGSIMKVGQLLSMYGEHFLPANVNKILKSLQCDTPALEWNCIEETIQKSLGDKFSELQIDTRAFAAASIGQVHAARVKNTGEQIVLKVQYPGVARAISSDLKALKTLALFAPGISRGPRLDQILHEIEEMLWRETDYTSEANDNDRFKTFLADDSRFLIPNVLRHWSTPQVLAMQRICGHRLDSPEIQALDQNRRNSLAEALLDLYLRELFSFGCMQTDPHIGNYRVRIQGERTFDNQDIHHDTIVLLDFGAVRDFPIAFINRYRELVRSSLRQDEDGVRNAGLDLGFLKPCDPPTLTSAFYSFCRLMVEPFDPEGAGEDAKKYFDDDGRYDWRNNSLPSRLVLQMKEMIRAREFRMPPHETIFLDRKSTGLFTLLATLGAQTRGHETLRKYLSETESPAFHP